MYAVLSKAYTNGDEKLYAEEKNFDKLAEIISDAVGDVDKKETLQVLKEGSQENQYQVDIPNAKSISLQQREKKLKMRWMNKILLVYTLPNIHLVFIQMVFFFLSFYWICRCPK